MDLYAKCKITIWKEEALNDLIWLKGRVIAPGYSLLEYRFMQITSADKTLDGIVLDRVSLSISASCVCLRSNLLLNITLIFNMPTISWGF